ncbi:MAG: metallophosphoesterase [Oscillospiraceae bacterium]
MSLAQHTWRALPKGRTVVVSDVHGDPDAFGALLRQLAFTPRECLVILGDLTEKGPDSLGLLRCVMALGEKQPVLALRGNCDDAVCELVRIAHGQPAYWLQNLPRYLRHQGRSIIGEMMATCGLAPEDAADLERVARTLYAAFRKEMDYLAALPDIIETDAFLFVHAGLRPGDATRQSRRDCLLFKAFGEWAEANHVHFEKPCVVGHWPTCNYHHTQHSYAPVIGRGTGVISIDGGHQVKPGAMLHALIIEDGRAEGLRFASYDPMPAMRAVDAQPGFPAQPLTLTWLDRFVQPLCDEGENVLCRHLKTGRKLWVPRRHLSRQGGRWAAPDCTNDHLPLAAGSVVHLLEEGPLGALVRRGTRAGWYGGRLEPL